MPTEPKTVTKFNDYLGEFLQTVLPKNITARGMKELSAFKLLIFDVFFGANAFGTGLNEEELKNKSPITFEDSPNSVTGIKAENFKESFYKELINSLDKLKADQKFINELEDLYNKDPDLRQDITRAKNIVALEIGIAKAKSKAVIEQERKAEFEQLVIDTEAFDPIFGFIESPTEKAKYTKYLEGIKDKIFNIVYSKKRGTYKTIKQIGSFIEKRAGSSFSIIAWASIFAGARAIFGKIPILLGPVPLKHVDYVEIARSGKILKFRATGTVFLAKQEGGADAIKIEGTMYKIEFLLLFLLWGLFIYGQSKFKEMDALPSLTSAQSIFEVRKLNDLIMTDTSLQKPSYEFHQTFPFVSRHFIIPHCYIETISIEDKLPLKDVLKYTILLRTYDKPQEVSSSAGKGGKVLYGLRNKTKSAKVVEASLNAGWRTLNATGWLLNEHEWKIGSANKSGVLDTYYDVDWSTYATVTYLSLMGVIT